MPARCADLNVNINATFDVTTQPAKRPADTLAMWSSRRRHGSPRPAVAVACAAALSACGPSPPTSDGCKVKLLPGDLVITEVFADFKAANGTGGIDTGKEWFEIYNAKGQPIDLQGLTITHSRTDGTRSSTHTISRGSVAPGQFFTLGSAAPGSVPAYIDYGYGSDLGDLFNTDGGKLALACGDSEIDSASYDGRQGGPLARAHRRPARPTTRSTTTRPTGARPTTPSSRPATSARRAPTTIASRSRPASATTAARCATPSHPATRRSRDHRGDAEPEQGQRRHRRVVRGQGHERRRSQRRRPRPHPRQQHQARRHHLGRLPPRQRPAATWCSPGRPIRRSTAGSRPRRSPARSSSR